VPRIVLLKALSGTHTDPLRTSGLSGKKLRSPSMDIGRIAEWSRVRGKLVAVCKMFRIVITSALPCIKSETWARVKHERSVLRIYEQQGSRFGLVSRLELHQVNRIHTSPHIACAIIANQSTYIINTLYSSCVRKSCQPKNSNSLA
jgi:hypothetical protein